MTNKKYLVAYFSKTGTTQEFAQKIGKIINAPLYRINEKETYTPEDINWTVEDCRANRENNDPSCRPELKAYDLPQDFDILVLGFPLWWGEAPKVVRTFLESYDFTNKEIVLFCTSQMTPIYQTQMNLKYGYPKLTFKGGSRVNNFNDSQLKAWTKTFYRP